MILTYLHRSQLLPLLLLIHYISGQSINCPQRSGRWPDPTQCDAYLECVEGLGERLLCPDGLVFSTERFQYSYPCVYPQEADCTSRPTRQPAQPTEECPHQFGMYGLGDSSNCGKYMACSNGRAYIKDCPEGLAYNELSLRCDWPDLVPSCNVEAFVGFTCPTLSPHGYYGDATSYDFYRSPAACDRFLICIAGKPRLLICSPGLLFDSDTNTCRPAENVTSCYNSAGPRTNQNPPRFQSNSFNPNSFSSSNDYYG